VAKKRIAPDTEMPFLDHLEELRQRLFWIAGAIFVGVVASFVLLSQKRLDLVGLLAEPIKPYLKNGSLVYTHPGTSFKIILNASVISGILIATPVIGYQLWGFFSPALHPHEKRVIVPTLMGMVVLFLGGVALCYFVVLPFTLRFFHGFESQSLTPMILLLSALGILDPKTLTKYRRHALVVCVIAAAFITPDASPTTLFALAGPLYFLFELGVVLSFAVTRKRRQREKEALLEEQRLEAQRRAARDRSESQPREPRRLGVTT
jgi:sec-independent protein translocase protein TatC